MNTKKIMIYSSAVLAVVIVLKIMVAMSWKLIIVSIIGMGIWFLFDKLIRPKYNQWKELEQIKPY